MDIIYIIIRVKKTRPLIVVVMDFNVMSHMQQIRAAKPENAVINVMPDITIMMLDVRKMTVTIAVLIIINVQLLNYVVMLMEY